MVAYLQKPAGSDEFHQIVDFLNVSHIRDALTTNPTIYVSLIKQFSQTATAKTLDNGEIEITAIIDGTVKTVTRASVRRHLQLADADGISSLPTTKILEQLSFIGNMKRASKGYTRESVVSQPKSPIQIPIADETVHKERGESMERAATTVASLDVKQDSVNTLASDEDSLKLQELMVLCTKLSTKVDSLEADTKQTKQIYGAAFTKLINKVKTLEKTIKSSQAKRKARIVVSNDEEDLEDPSKQGRKIAEINEDPDISLVQHDAEVQGRHEHDMEPNFEFTTAKEVYTAKKGVSTAELVSTAGALVSTAGDSLAKDKGKGIMEEAEMLIPNLDRFLSLSKVKLPCINLK
ncbi:hypothetical protein Tco_0844683 [Tanacetum coccineum]